MAAAPISEASSGIRRHQLCKGAPILFPGFEDGASDETIIMDQSFGASLLRVRSINLHATLIARFHFLSRVITAGNSLLQLGLNSGILDTKQTERASIWPPQRLSAIKEIKSRTNVI